MSFQRWNDTLTHITVESPTNAFFGYQRECPKKFFLGRQRVAQKCLTLRLDKWMARMFEYGFEENIGYIPVSQKRLTVQGNETTFTDYIITVDMTKEISMIQGQRNANKQDCTSLSVKLYNGGLDAITAHKELLALEAKELK